MGLVVVSPHLDDAVLSCGQLLAASPGAMVVTALAGPPPMGDMLTSYDRDSGFTSSGQAVAVRQAEDAAALALLRAEPAHLDFPDRQYGQDVDLEALVEALTKIMGEADPAVVLCPLGIHHPDHILVGLACHHAIKRAGTSQAWLYEDLPARVLWPEEIPGRVEWWAAQGRKAALEELEEAGARALKEAALDCYRSQLWAIDRPCALAPERFWRLS